MRKLLALLRSPPHRRADRRQSLRRSAVLYGTPDGNAHPYVGIVALLRRRKATTSGAAPAPLIDADTVLLTAGPLRLRDRSRPQVWFTETASDDRRGALRRTTRPASPATPYRPIPATTTSPRSRTRATWASSCSTGSTASGSIRYAQLPTEGLADTLYKHELFDDRRLSASRTRRPVAGRRPCSGSRRRRSSSALQSGYSAGFNLQLSSNAGKPASRRPLLRRLGRAGPLRDDVCWL